MKMFKLLLLVLSVSGCATIPTSILKETPTDHRQILIVETDPVLPTKAKLSLWEHQESWRRIYGPVPAVVGRNSLALPLQKREGDGRTPSGTFEISRAFGYYPDVVTGLDYKVVTSDDIWIDDTSHPKYNQWVQMPTDAQSFEKLRRDDEQYKLAVVIEYNTSPVTSGAGSAIFMHIWRRYDHPTAGCVALSEKHLRKILAKLDKAKKPVIVIRGPYRY